MVSEDRQIIISDKNELSRDRIDELSSKSLLTLISEKPRQSSKVGKISKVHGTVRVKSGCFCCRKRKKKCDEKQPSCSGCKRNFLKCVYPSYVNQILPRDFELEPADVMVSSTSTTTTPPNSNLPNEIKHFINDNTDDDDDVDLGNNNNQLSFLANDPSFEYLNNSSQASQLINIDTDLSQFLNNPMSILSNFSQWVPNVQMNSVDSELYFHFIHQFMPSVSPSYSHPKLSPKEVWVPLASKSEILRQVFYSCGASQLAYKYPEYQQLSIDKYNKSVRMISDEIVNNKVEGTEDWLLAAILTLCLRDRASGYNGSRCSQHLVAAYKIICERGRKKMLSGIELASLDQQQQQEQVMDIGSDSEFKVAPTERTLVESFIFNYCIALYTCSYGNLIKLPSPFKVFPEMTRWLRAPIYDDVAVPWMNNPILGSSLLEFEMISKLTWLLRFHYCVDTNDVHHIDEDAFWNLITLLKAKLDSIELSLFDNLDRVEAAQNKESLRTSLSISFIMFHASKILLQKLINPALPLSFASIQQSVSAILKESTMIPKHDHSMCLCVLGIFIAGAACVTEADKEFITKQLVDLSDLLYSNFGLNVLGILQRSWNREQLEIVSFGDAGYKSFNLIFDRDEVEVISF